MASVAARVNVRDVLRVKAVDSYVRNFAGERDRLQEILEITLSYGVYCVSRNFQLKGITVDELRTVTKYDQTKTQDFYVRNATKPRRPEGLRASADPQQLFVKAPHTWRDGDNRADGIETNVSDPRALQTTNDTQEPEVFFLPSEAHKDKLDEIDFYTRVLGKPFVDVAWTTYSSRGSAYLDCEQLQERITRVEQRKRPDQIPATEFPVCSFVEFMNAYVKTSVGKTASLQQSVQRDAPLREENDDTSVAVASVVTPRRATGLDTRRTIALDQLNSRAPLPKSKTTHSPRTGQGLLSRGALRSKSLQHVESKIKPELQAHKDKLLRVKKTQTQLMKESLARARLAEYEAKKSGDATPITPVSVKRMPLNKITPGAAALEIVDDFIRSPLMDQFSEGVQVSRRQHTTRSSRRDPLKEELYGTAAHDDSFVGCKVPPSSTNPSVRKSSQVKPGRDYRGWLGDFGPQHTKTVQPAWDTDLAGDVDGGDSSSDAENERRDTNRLDARADGQRDRFEWKFELPGEPSKRRSTATRSAGDELGARSLDNDADADNEDSISMSDGWSAPRSDKSDPVFRWLEAAVQ